MTNQERRDLLKAKLNGKANSKNTVLKLIDEISSKFEVDKYTSERYELLTLMRVVHKVVTSKGVTARITLDLEKSLGVRLEYFTELRKAYGWSSFITDQGNLIEEREGNAELVKDLLFIIEEELKLEPQEDNYEEITQEFFDTRNKLARDQRDKSQQENDDFIKLINIMGA